MSTDFEMLWLYPTGEVVRESYPGYQPVWQIFNGKPVGTCVRIGDYWCERVEKYLYRNYPEYSTPAHIRAKCLLLGIQP